MTEGIEMIDGSLLRQICYATNTHPDVVRSNIISICSKLGINLDNYEIKKEYVFKKNLELRVVE